MTDTLERSQPFIELPAALVEEAMQITNTLSAELLKTFQELRKRRQDLRQRLEDADLIRRIDELPYTTPPTSAAVDGAYAVERLLATDFVAIAAVSVEGLTPPSEQGHWPEPRHSVLLRAEPHAQETSLIARALMLGMELKLAIRAPHQVTFLDGSLTTPVIYFNQALSRLDEAQGVSLARELRDDFVRILSDYRDVLASKRTDRYYVAVPKYSTRREIGRSLGLASTYDDRGLLSLLLAPGEFTKPLPLQGSHAPWHLTLKPFSGDPKHHITNIRDEVLSLLDSVHVLYYRPNKWLPALRLELSQSVVQNKARLATVIHAVRYQCGTPSVFEPYPLYMADRMVKHLPRALPAFRQVTSQHLAETYPGDINDIFFALHGYRTDAGQ